MQTKRGKKKKNELFHTDSYVLAGAKNYVSKTAHKSRV